MFLCINNGTPEGHPQQALVDDSQILMTHAGASLTHIPLLANQSADNLVISVDIPPSTRQFIIEGSLGIGDLNVKSFMEVVCFP